MKKRYLTGIKPTEDQIHIGNVFGAVMPMIEMKKENPDDDFFLFLANMHGFTNVRDKEQLKNNSLNILKIYLSVGLNKNDFLIYNPAQIPGHAQLSRVLTCITHMGFMERMHAYKDAVSKGKANEISVGVFTYPILMASDIILYDANFVPIGKDQKQHVEYARDIAIKFNKLFGDTFEIPQALIKKEVATIPGIDGRKMSKSYSNFIGILDDEKTILKKIKQISTDTKPIEEPKDPDECNVYNIIKILLNSEEDSKLRKKYKNGGLSYKYVKDYLFEKLMEFLKPIQKKYSQINEQEILDMLDKNSKFMNEIAGKKIDDVYKKIGFYLN